MQPLSLEYGTRKLNLSPYYSILETSERKKIRSSGRIPEQFSEIKRSMEYLVPVECNQEPVPCSFWSSNVNDMSVADSNVLCVVMNAEGTTPTVMNSRGKPGRRAAITSNFKRQTFY